MKPETRERAAWRTFGLLTPEEQGAFDAAAKTNAQLADARDQMEVLAAAVSVIHSRPVAPDAEVLGLIEGRCGISGGRKVANSRARLRSILQWAGWGVAAVLAVLLAVRGRSGSLTAGQPSQPVTAGTADNPRRPEVRSPRQRIPFPDKSFPRTLESPGNRHSPAGPSGVAHGDGRPPAAVVSDHSPGISPVSGKKPQEPTSEPSEKRRLIQEIETLRAELTLTGERNREVLSPAPGRSWPLIVEMKPPSATRDDSDPPLISKIADALAGKTTQESKLPADQKQTAETPQLASASAIPVYDPARDTGTLAVRNLPALAANTQYNLWVSTATAVEPVLVGTLPDNLLSTDSLDFSLGSTGIVPASYFLTVNSVELDTANSVRGTLVDVPNSSNIVLQGP